MCAVCPRTALAQGAEPEPTDKTGQTETPPAVESDKPKPVASPVEVAPETRPQAGDVAPKPVAAPDTAPKQKESTPKENAPETGFFLGSYGRAVSATDFRKRPGRDADIVARGSRLDEGSYVEIDVQRQDYWKATGATTRAVVTLGASGPLFHYNADFTVRMAVRNLFLQANNIMTKGFSAWVGSRMYRGDDSYLLDFWPLDNLNTMGGGVRYDFASGRTFVAWHAGLNQPNTGFFRQLATRTPPLNQPGSTTVAVLDRQKFITSFKASHIIPRGKGGVKLVGYGEIHDVPSGQRETEVKGTFETLPGDNGGVIGAQIGAFTGTDASHVNLFIRYAGGAAAYGEFGTPTQLAPDRTSTGARELWITMSGNWEIGNLGLMGAAYIRSFRNASPALDFADVDEGIVMARPHFFLADWGGVALEGSYQAQQRGVRSQVQSLPGQAIPLPSNEPLFAGVTRIGVIPFLNPAGKGSYSRPQLRLMYVLTHRDEAARTLYAKDDFFSIREWEHFFGVGVEWWFNAQTTYGG
jgi:maltoporin